MEEHYQFQTLHTKEYIRLLVLHPGRFDDDLVISISPIPFDPEIICRYEALSYAWDEDQDVSSIWVGDDKRLAISITGNLKMALIHLRCPDRRRVMWVDSLCINQQDNVEKGPYVALMGKIYRSAAGVIAWLGTERDDSTRALNTMTWIGNQVKVDYSRWHVNRSAECLDPSFEDMDADIPLREEDTRAIYHLVSRRWFERLWIRQEILASETQATVQCGLYQVPWVTFRRALLCLYMKRRPWSSFEERLYTRLLSLRGLIGQPPLVELANSRVIFGQSDCTDPRDRVYALLEFLPESDKAVVGVPDYTTDAPVIFREIMWRWILHYGSLNLLTQAEPGLDHLESAPSWIPDWSKKEVIFGRNYWRGFASSQFGPACTISTDHQIITALGIATMKITRLQAIPVMKSRHVSEVENALRQLLPPAGFGGNYPTGIGMLEAYARTFLADALAEKTEPWRGEDPTLEEAMSIISDLHASKGGPPSKQRALGPSDAFFKIARAMVGGKQLICTSTGYLGIAPVLARLDDVICVLLGCHSPMVLRQLEGGRFRAVGEAYVLGLSEAEALLGSLPRHIRRVFRSDAKCGIYSCFVNSLTGDESLEDPRISSLSFDLAEFRRQLEMKPSSTIQLPPNILQRHFPGLRNLEIV